MPITINTNTSASAALGNLNKANSRLQMSLQRLSSGSRIASPSDDAGGLAVSTKLQATLNRQRATDTNLANSISYLQTQDGALKTAGQILDRISELKTLSGDVTKNATDRSNYDTEFQQLKAQLSSIGSEKFNGLSLFTASTKSVYTTAAGAAGAATAVGGTDLLGSANSVTQLATFTDPFTGPLDPDEWNTFGPVSASGGVATLGATAVIQPWPTFYEKPVNLSFDVRIASGSDTFTLSAIGDTGTTVFDSAGQGIDDGGWHSISLDIAADGTVTQSIDGGASAPNGTGPATEDPLSISLIAGFMNSGNVEVRNYVFSGYETVNSGSNVGTVANASDLANLDLSVVKSALEDVAGYRATNGAQQSRLQFASEMLKTNQANLEAANSRIADVDIAQESTALARYNVLAQAGASMLSQANSSQQIALRLIG